MFKFVSFFLLLCCLFISSFIFISSSSEAAPDVQEIIDMAKKGEKIRTKLVTLDGELGHAQYQVKLARKNYRKFKRELEQQEKQLIRTQKAYETSREKLVKATQAYVALANSLGEQTFDGDGNVLKYLASAHQQDVVLVYAITENLINGQQKKLVTLKYAATQQAQSTLKFEKEVQRQKLLVQQRKNNIKLQKQHTTEIDKLSKQAEKEFKAYKKIERSYARQFMIEMGEEGSLDEEGLGDAVMAETSLNGKLIWPVNGSVSSDFSHNRCLQGLCRPHEGIDISTPVNTNVYASASGEVSVAGEVGGYGKMVCVQHASNIETCYAHLNQITVKINQKVKKKKVIGESGCTGRCFGPHLHYEIRINRKAVDPLPHLPHGRAN